MSKTTDEFLDNFGVSGIKPNKSDRLSAVANPKVDKILLDKGSSLVSGLKVRKPKKP